MPDRDPISEAAGEVAWFLSGIKNRGARKVVNHQLRKSNAGLDTAWKELREWRKEGERIRANKSNNSPEEWDRLWQKHEERGQQAFERENGARQAYRDEWAQVWERMGKLRAPSVLAEQMKAVRRISGTRRANLLEAVRARYPDEPSLLERAGAITPQSSLGAQSSAYALPVPDAVKHIAAAIRSTSPTGAARASTQTAAAGPSSRPSLEWQGPWNSTSRSRSRSSGRSSGRS
ncbi:hypothetical protein [Streptomyces axinellae]|uniref:Uncharacterized protein n=1 Tax=Streptomyces axinellae TaxID=552788 RepID=A0ABP6DAU2_9ACTN